MEDFDDWVADGDDTLRPDGLGGQPFAAAQPAAGLLGLTTAWHSKRQRIVPSQQQQQDPQQHRHNQAPQDVPSANQHTAAEHPTGHPAPTSSNWISRQNHHHHHHHQQQQQQQQQYTQETQPAASAPWHAKGPAMQGTADGSLGWGGTAADPPGAPAAAPVWHQKQRQQQQQQMHPSTSAAPNPTAPAHAFQAGAYQQYYSSSRNGYTAGARGRGGDDLWGNDEGEGCATAGQQQQQQQHQHQQELWGEDEGDAGQQQQEHWRQQQQQQGLWNEDDDNAGQQGWSDDEYAEGLQQQQQQQHWEGGVWGEEEEADDADQQQQQQQQDETEGEEEDGEDDQQQEEQQEEEQEVQLESADFDLSRDEVIERIEQLAFELITGVGAGQLPTLSCISTARSNVHMAPRHSTLTTTGGRGTQGLTQQGSAASRLTQQGLGAVAAAGPRYSEEDDEAGYEETAAAAAAAGVEQQHVLRLGSKVQTKSLMASGGAQANSIVRALQLLDSVHALLRSGRNSTQRDVYYNLVGRPGFQATRDVSSAIRSVLGILRVPRSALGISAASKGAVAGCLLLRPRPGEAWVDCRSVGPSGRPIPGEVGAVDATALRPAGARFILVVEKDAVFQSLVESRLHEQLPCIIITGRGMPDVASRAFLAAVVEASKGWGIAATAATGGYASLSSQWQQQQSLPVLGLVDWNPGGVSILLAYKYGAAALGLESARYAVPSLCWLGVTSHMLQEGMVPQSRCHALSDRDRTLMPGLKARLAGCAGWVQELEEMEGLGLKADIEALQHDDLMRQVQQRVLQGSYLR